MALISATADDYRALLQRLLPPGPAWREDDPLLAALAPELARLHNRVGALVEEADPRATIEMLQDWERVAGLPDSCLSALDVSQSYAQRIAALVSRITATGGQSPAYYVELAAALGYEITVAEFALHTVNDDVDAPLYAAPWQHAWQVNAGSSTVGVLSVDDTVDDPLAWWGNESLECVIRRLKPAQTHVIFSYT